MLAEERVRYTFEYVSYFQAWVSFVPTESTSEASTCAVCRVDRSNLHAWRVYDSQERSSLIPCTGWKPFACDML